MEVIGILLFLALIGGAIALWVRRRRDPDRVAQRFGGGSNR